MGDDLAGGVDGADIFEDIISDSVFGSVGHMCITACFAEKSKVPKVIIPVGSDLPTYVSVGWTLPLRSDPRDLNTCLVV